MAFDGAGSDVRSNDALAVLIGEAGNHIAVAVVCLSPAAFLSVRPGQLNGAIANWGEVMEVEPHTAGDQCGRSTS
jgi:hypothetical protein